MTSECRDDHGDGKPTISLDRHSTRYRTEFEELADDLHAQCPVAWNDTHEGYWFANGNKELFDLARRPDVLSSDNDVTHTKRGYRGTSIPPGGGPQRGGFLEMDPPEQRYYRQSLNPYLSPAAVARWVPVVEDITRACLDEKIESGRIDFVDDLANIVPAVFTLAMLGIPLKEWELYVEPIHAVMYTPPGSPEFARVREMSNRMGQYTLQSMAEIREDARPGLIHQLLTTEINGVQPDDMEILGVIGLIIGGGFDTTTALMAHALEWLSQHPDQRMRLIKDRGALLDTATEEFLRFYTPTQGAARTFTEDVEINGTQFKEGERVWFSWAMSNRDEKVFPDPHHIQLDRPGNRHHSFGLGIHRCIGSNVARSTFKIMLNAVLDRMPDFVCDPAGTMHYGTVGQINGMRKLPATFTPGPRLGAGLAETVDRIQVICDEQRLAEPVTIHRAAAKLDG